MIILTDEHLALKKRSEGRKHCMLWL